VSEPEIPIIVKPKAIVTEKIALIIEEPIKDPQADLEICKVFSKSEVPHI
jgi:hypothetical protein